MTEESPRRPKRDYEGDRRPLDLSTIRTILSNHGELAPRDRRRLTEAFENESSRPPSPP